MLKVVADEAAREDLAASLDEIVREGARRMLAAALEDEVGAYIAAHAGERDEGGRRLVVRNGHARPREVTTAAGAVEVTAPRVNDRRVDERTGERARPPARMAPRRRPCRSSRPAPATSSPLLPPVPRHEARARARSPRSDTRPAARRLGRARWR